MIEILKAVLFGIVQGITEWLPVSSTGHMILVNEFVTLNVTPEFWDAFLVVIQFGSILAVVVLFWNKIMLEEKLQKYYQIISDHGIPVNTIIGETIRSGCL